MRATGGWLRAGRRGMSRRAPKNVAPLSTPLSERYVVQLGCVLGSMLAGSTAAHAVLQPDTRIPELNEDGSRVDGQQDRGAEFLRRWRAGEKVELFEGKPAGHTPPAGKAGVNDAG